DRRHPPQSDRSERKECLMVAILIPSLPHRRQALLAILLAGVTAQVPPNLELSLVPQVGHLDDVLAIDVSADGALTASAGADDVAISPDGRVFATTQGNRSANVWSADSGAQNADLSGHRSAVQVVAISADGAYVASGAKDGAIVLWEPRKGPGSRTMCAHSAA